MKANVDYGIETLQLPGWDNLKENSEVEFWISQHG